MGRPRNPENRHWPKHVAVNHGTFYWRTPGGGNAEMMRHADGSPIRQDDEGAMYRWVGERLKPIDNRPMKTMNDAFDRYERETLPTLAPRTMRDYRRHLKVLRKEFGHRRPSDIKPKDIGLFLDVDKGKIQRNRMVAVLSAVYTKMVGRWWMADSNPCLKVERNPSKPRDRNVTDAEFMAVYKRHGPRVQIAMDLALLTGQRQGDLLRLKWSQVTPEGVTFRQSKTGKRLMVELSPALEAVLQRARAQLPNLPREYVLRRRDGKPYSENGFRAIWQRVMRKHVRAGGERFTFHDLRAKSGSDSETIQAAYERLGHTSQAMTRRVYDRGVRKVKPLR